MLTLAINILQSSEPLPTEWTRTYGGTGYDSAYSAIQTSDGGYAISGFTESFEVGLADFWLVKLGPKLGFWYFSDMFYNIEIGGIDLPIFGHITGWKPFAGLLAYSGLVTGTLAIIVFFLLSRQKDTT